jgi:hypothetical protein
MVQLFFVRGWPVRTICERYGISKAMAHKLLAEWRIRAIESGHIQEIEPGALDGLLQEANAREPGAVNVPAALVETSEAVPERGAFVFEAASSGLPGSLSAGSGV